MFNSSTPRTTRICGLTSSIASWPTSLLSKPGSLQRLPTHCRQNSPAPSNKPSRPRPTESSEAHQLYLRGRYFVGKRGAENLTKAIDYFNQSVAKDPNYALAYAGLSDCYDLCPNGPK